MLMRRVIMHLVYNACSLLVQLDIKFRCGQIVISVLFLHGPVSFSFSDGTETTFCRL